MVQQVSKSLGLAGYKYISWHVLTEIQKLSVLSKQKNPFFTYRKDVFFHSINKIKQNGSKQRGPDSCRLPSP